jgi:hypothetical protein
MAVRQHLTGERSIMREKSARRGSVGDRGGSIAACLSLAAAPTFAFMAVLAALGDVPDRLCPPGRDTSPLTGMAAMYLLMSAFHLPPWLKLMSSRH